MAPAIIPPRAGGAPGQSAVMAVSPASLLPRSTGVLPSVRHWGVAALARRGACVNMLGFGHGAGIRTDWRDLWHRFSAPGAGGEGRAKASLPPDPLRPPGNPS